MAAPRSKPSCEKQKQGVSAYTCSSSCSPQRLQQQGFNGRTGKSIASELFSIMPADMTPVSLHSGTCIQLRREHTLLTYLPAKGELRSSRCEVVSFHAKTGDGRCDWHRCTTLSLTPGLPLLRSRRARLSTLNPPHPHTFGRQYLATEPSSAQCNGAATFSCFVVEARQALNYAISDSLALSIPFLYRFTPWTMIGQLKPIASLFLSAGLGENSTTPNKSGRLYPRPS